MKWTLVYYLFSSNCIFDERASTFDDASLLNFELGYYIRQEFEVCLLTYVMLCSFCNSTIITFLGISGNGAKDPFYEVNSQKKTS